MLKSLTPHLASLLLLLNKLRDLASELPWRQRVIFLEDLQDLESEKLNVSYMPLPSKC